MPRRPGFALYFFPSKTCRALLPCFILLSFLSGFIGVAHCQQTNILAGQFLPTADLTDVDGDGNQDIVIETAKLRLVIAGKTGGIGVYFLKGEHFNENMFPPPLQDLGFPFATDTLFPFDCMVGTGTIDNFGYNLEIEEKTADRVVIVSTANVSPKPGRPYLGLTKRFIFSTNGYSFEAEFILSNLSDEAVAVGNDVSGGVALQYGPGVFLEPFTPEVLLGLRAAGSDKFDTIAALEKGRVGQTFTGIGLKTNYFCMLIDAKSPANVSAREFQINGSDTAKPGHTYTGHVVRVAMPPVLLKPKESRPFKFQIYYGPKALDELRLFNREEVTDYGFLSTLCLRILQFFNAIYPNYGLSIIFLTVIVRILLYPLTLKQTKSMAKVQKIQPMVQDLKDRYRDNQQKFNEEVLKLYQKHDVNPLGGCLPLLLQLPILFALYNTINIAVELRKTPFLWMTDLSKADPLLILPIAVAALMYYQQGQMQNTDQQQMMAFMPMFMFVITWSLPAGLLVYWFTSSVLGVFQQVHVNRIMAAIKEEKP